MNILDWQCPTCKHGFQYCAGTIPYCPWCQAFQVFKPETSPHPLQEKSISVSPSIKKVSSNIGGTHV